jgi:hypothetical protein
MINGGTMQVEQASPTRAIPRFTLFKFVFVGLLLLAGFSLAQTSKAQMAPASNLAPLNGTIPPGGTIPPPEIDLFNGQIRVVHVAPFDADIANTAIDICTETNTPVTGFTGLTYLSQSGYLTFPAQAYDWKVATPGCGATLVDIPPFNLHAGGVVTLYIVGDGANQPLTTVLSIEVLGLGEIRYLPIIAQNIEE